MASNRTESTRYLENRYSNSYESRNYGYNGFQRVSMKTKIKRFMKTHLLVILIITGAITGFIIGISVNKAVQDLKQPSRYTVVIILGFPGEILIRLLKMLILPLITCSLIVGLANLDSKVSGKIGGRAVVYYLSTTVLAAILGLLLVSAIKPGNNMTRPVKEQKQQLVRPLDSFLDIVRNMFPSNIIKACVEQDKTKIIMGTEVVGQHEEVAYVANLSQTKINQLIVEKKLRKVMNNQGSLSHYAKLVHETNTFKIGDGLITKGRANFLGVIVFAIAVGIIAGRMGKEAKVFVQFLTVFNNIVTKLVILVMWYAPIGIGSLIAARFAEMKDIEGVFSSLGLFIVTVVTGIAIHGFLVLPLIFFLLTRNNPYIYLRGVLSAMATAFGTDSSAATLPVTLECLEENLKVDKRITRFILPVGTTINMDGTALYEAVSAIFIAQAVGQTLSFGDYVAISFTSILASVGAAAIPHAGLVTMLIVLDTVGLPSDMVAVIFSVDWFLDRVRTMVNVLGDAYGAGIVQHLSRADLAKDDAMKNLPENYDENEEEETQSKYNGKEHLMDSTENHPNRRTTTYL